MWAGIQSCWIWLMHKGWHKKAFFVIQQFTSEGVFVSLFVDEEIVNGGRFTTNREQQAYIVFPPNPSLTPIIWAQPWLRSLIARFPCSYKVVIDHSRDIGPRPLWRSHQTLDCMREGVSGCDVCVRKRTTLAVRRCQSINRLSGLLQRGASSGPIRCNLSKWKPCCRTDAFISKAGSLQGSIC